MLEIDGDKVGGPTDSEFARGKTERARSNSGASGEQ
jgi:hypothetical protein